MIKLKDIKILWSKWNSYISTTGKRYRFRTGYVEICGKDTIFKVDFDEYYPHKYYIEDTRKIYATPETPDIPGIKRAIINILKANPELQWETEISPLLKQG